MRFRLENIQTKTTQIHFINIKNTYRLQIIHIQQQ